ncbi:hypothetical protein C0J52_24956 [Blattella germanica]|nr:hypothetical protein C0J52_24956 [Blattella germanica]
MQRQRLTHEQKIFAYDTYIKTESCREVCRQFVDKFPGVPVPHRNTVRNLVVRLRETGSFSDRARRGKKRVLTEEKLVLIEKSLQNAPEKSLSRVSKETGVSKSSAYRATKLLHLKSHRVCEEDQEVRPPRDGPKHSYNTSEYSLHLRNNFNFWGYL